MAIPSLLRARRSANRPVEMTQQAIIFCVRDHWFALPMAAVKRVGSFESSGKSSGGASERMTESTAHSVDQELTIVSAAQKIFGDEAAPDKRAADLERELSDAFLIVFETSRGQALGLAISSPPKMQRIALSSIAPFVPGARFGHVHCVSSIATQTNDPQTLLLLDPDRLC
jgi:chemotaxis signal transduction protein